MVTSFSDIIDNFILLFGTLVLFLITLSIVYFLYGIAVYITKYGDEAKRTESLKVIAHGLIAIFVMFAVWGLTALVLGLIGEKLTLIQLSYNYLDSLVSIHGQS